MFDLPLSELAAEYDPYVASGEINSEVEDKAAAVDRVLEVFANGWVEGGRVHGGAALTCEPCLQEQGLASMEVTVRTMDGTTVSAADGSWWFNLRPSNTEPFLRYNGEAKDEATMVSVRDAVLELVRQDS